MMMSAWDERGKATKPPEKTLSVPVDSGGSGEWQARLHLSQKMETLGRLASGVAHDLNNLLAVILGYSEMLLQELEGGDPDHDRLAREIHKAADLGASFTRHLLAYCCTQPTPAQLVNVGTVVANLESLLRRLLGKAITLDITIGSDVASVRAEPGRLEQVVMNLVLNARDAMSDGGRLTIEVTAAGSGPPGPGVWLTVSDTGCGMDAETRSRLFEPFFTTKGQGQGTGLGLTIVQDIVQQAGGTIQVDSSPGHGTTIRVWLPRADA